MTRAAIDAANAWAQLHDRDFDAPFGQTSIGPDSLFDPIGREGRSLAGAWLFTIDPFLEGLRQRWVERCFLPRERQTGPFDYHIDGSETIELPASLGAVRPELLHYDGPAWFGRWIDPPALAPGERLFLRIGAAAGRCTAFFDGRCLGRHVGGYGPFCVELPPFEERGFLHLLCDNRRRADGIPTDHFDWHDYGGVHRAIELFALPAVFVRDSFVRLEADARGERILARLRLSDPVSGAGRIAIEELGIDREIPIEDGSGEIAIEARPERWRLERPKLYAVELSFGEDRVVKPIGFRTIERRGREISLNGEPIFLRGICAHEDDAFSGRVTSADDLERRFRHAGELGANFLRLAHYPHDEGAALMADRLGFLLWEEIPVYWAVAFERPETRAQALDQLEELVLRDRERASVIAWGIGNENADTDDRLDFMRALADRARTLDPSRLIAAACLVDKKNKRLSDRLAASLDLVGVNEYYGWYDPDIADLIEIAENWRGDAPIVISETGADALAGKRGAADEWFTEDFQADYFARQLETVARLDAIVGFCPWILYDFRAHRRQAAEQAGFNLKGLIARDKSTKKRAFEVVARAYRGGFGDRAV